MNSRVEIFVSGNTSNAVVVGGALDLFPDEEINIVYSIKDVKDIASTTSSYSQNFQIPGTKNNNQIFSNLFLIGADSTFDPRLKASCSIVVDSNVIIEGDLQIVSIDVADRDKPIYNIAIFGATKGFNSKIKNKYLTDYNWSGMNHVLSVYNIQNSWSGTSDNLGYYYSIKDYGYDYTLTNVKTTTQRSGIPIGNMFPDIYNKRIIDTIFSAEGYSYTSSFLSSTTFNQTVIPYSNDPNTIMGSDYLSGRTFIANNSTLSSITFNQMSIDPNWIQPYTYLFEYRIRANNIISGSAAATAYTQSSGGDYYTFDQPSISQFSLAVNYEYFVLPNAQRGQVGARFYRSGYAGGTVPFYEDLSVSEVAGQGYRIFTTPLCDNTSTWSQLGQTLKPFAPGEQVWASLVFKANMGYVQPNPMTQIPFKVIEGGLTWKHYPSAKRAAGQVVDMNNVIPKNVLATDYLKSVFAMFNCYIEPDNTVPNRFKIEPFEEYYAQGTEKNWSTKLDRSQAISEQLITEDLARKYKFTYKEDKDFLNEDYKSKRNEVYGQEIYDAYNEFTTKEETIECIFSPTPVDNVIGSNQFVVPKIGKYDSNGRFGYTAFNLRFLRKNPTPLQLPPGEVWGFTGNTNYTTYPYAGHLDHPFTGTTDYNWGSVPYVYYPWNVVTNNSITENNLVNLYWKKYLDEVSDKDAKLITAYFKLTPADIAQFRFNDKIYVEGLTSEGGHFFRVNSIVYTPTSNKPAKVELIKVLTKYTTKFPSRRILTVGTPVEYVGGPGVSLGGSYAVMPGSLGGGIGTVVNSTNTISFGENNIIRGNNDTGIFIGNDNDIAPAATGLTILGSYNVIGDTLFDSRVIGNNNQVINGSESSYVRGDSNIISLAYKSTIEGFNNIIDINQTDRSAYVNIKGYGNVTYGASTGTTIHGNENYVYAGTNNSSVYGWGNGVISATNSLIQGDYNTVTTADNVRIEGSGNTLTNATKVKLRGDSNIVGTNVSDSHIVGDNNVFLGYSTNIFLNGSNNTVNDYSEKVVIFGEANEIGAYNDGRYSTIFGSGNTLSGTAVSINGYNNTVYSGAGGINIYGDNNIVGSGVTNISILNLDSFVVTGGSDTVYTNNTYIDSILYMSTTSSSEQADGVAAGITSNAFGSGGTSSGDFSFTCGYNNVASGFSSFATGGYSVAAGPYSFVCGQFNSVSGNSSFGSGEFCEASKDFSFVGGKETVATRYAEFARSSAGNYGQYGSVMAFGTTASASTANLYLDAINNERFTIESNTSYMFKIKATAADYAITSSGMSACFEGSCLLKNVGGTVSAVGVPTVTQIYADSVLSSSNIILTGDNTNKALSIVADSGTGPGMIWNVEIDYVKVKHNPI